MIENVLSRLEQYSDGLRATLNPEDDAQRNGGTPETNLRQLLVLCHEHEDGKRFTPEQYAFLHGYVSALVTMQGN